ncbi:hypothetical protein BDZ91DRAFT_717072 [Kalaharituber pfeilii]|nr:hypothetical protein BDZ91DRAFT_717072 [Kalaharituber pfeilii]
MSDTEAMINVVPQAPPIDLDAHATVHDFIEYTEYLQSDIYRSLRLVGTLDHQYQQLASQLDTLCIRYGDLKKPTTPQQTPQENGNVGTPQYSVSEQDLGPLKLRLSIARKLNEAIRAREETSAEAVRLYDNVDRHFNKLSATLAKLQQIPLPDREPTPKPVLAPPDGEAQPRITLRLADRSRTASGPFSGRRRRGGATFGLGRGGTRRQTIRRDDEWVDIPEGGEKPIKRRGRRPGIGFQPKPLPPPPLTETGEPVDPLTLPWNRLLPHELARLRKRMKKNTQWTPSSTMILRELESLGRGIAHKDKYMHQIESGEYPHCSPEEGGIGSLATESNLFSTENRGMKLNAAKRRLKEAQAAAAAAGKAQNQANAQDKDKDTKMEDSVVVGVSKPIYPGKAMTPMGPVPTYSTNNIDTTVDDSAIASLVKPPQHVSRGKDPEAMNHLKLRATAQAPQSKPEAPAEKEPTHSPSPMNAISPARTSPPPPSPPQPAAEESESELSTSSAITASPTRAPSSPGMISEKSQVQSPQSTAGHKRKRSSASSVPSSPPSVKTKLSEATTSPAASTASEQSPAANTRKRGSISAPVAPPEKTKEPTPASPTAAATATAAGPPVGPAPEAKPPARRGRPPGTFKLPHKRRAAAAAAARAQALAKLDESTTEGQKPTILASTLQAKEYSPSRDDGEDFEEDMEINEHEPRYCTCGGVSHGTMLGCDNEEVREPISLQVLC